MTSVPPIETPCLLSRPVGISSLRFKGFFTHASGEHQQILKRCTGDRERSNISFRVGFQEDSPMSGRRAVRV